MYFKLLLDQIVKNYLISENQLFQKILKINQTFHFKTIFVQLI